MSFLSTRPRSAICRRTSRQQQHCTPRSRPPICPPAGLSMLPMSRSLRCLNWRIAGFRLYAKKKSSVSTAEFLATDSDDRAVKQAELMKVLNSRFGKGTTWKLDDAPAKVDTTPSGCLTLDLAMGGGYPKGRIIEIFGPESTGKSTLALHAIAEVQKAGGCGYYVDVENAFDGEYARKLGVTQNLLLSQPGCGEDALNIVDEVAKSGVAQIIVVDSVSALTPRIEIEGEIGMATIGTQARLMSGGLRKIVTSAAAMKCTVIFINQLRSKVGVLYGNPEVTSGGQALKYYASVRIDLRKKELIEAGSGSDSKDPIGVRIKAKVVKNKCAPPARIAEFDLLYGVGINALGSLLDVSQTLGVVTTRASFYYFDGNKIAQGREKTLAALRADPALLEQIDSCTKAVLASRSAPVLDSSDTGGIEVEDEEYPEILEDDAPDELETR